jgi:hypothetical protein
LVLNSDISDYGLLCNMTNTITIAVAMLTVALLAFAAVPLQALAQVSAGGTVGTGLEAPRMSISEPELPHIPALELPAIPELSDLPNPDLSANAEQELPAIPELSDLPNPDL